MDDSSDSEGPFQLYDQFQVIPSLRSNGPDRSDNSEEENTPPLEQTKKRKRGPDVQYILWRRFPDVQSFSRYWRDECASYRSKNSHSNETGAVSTWYCKYGRLTGYNCEHRVRIVYPHDNTAVEVYRSETPHDHEPVETVSALTPAIKQTLREHIRNGLQPQRMRVLLSESGVTNLPTLKQVQNFVSRERSETSGPITDVQLQAYCDKAANVPESLDEPFVFGWKYEAPDRFFVMWTTRRLLDLQKAQSLLQCDCTSCVNWQSFPLGVYGYSDCNRRFTPTFLSVGPSEDTHHYASVFQSLRQAGYEPQYVLGDGAGGLTAAVRKVFPDCTRLMCYAHTERRVSKKLSGLPQAMREKLLEDVRTLRFARDDQEFDNMCNAMMDVWPDEAARFTEYFRSTWATGDLRLWFEGASPFCSTNNGLESANKQIKDAHTLRQKLPFGRFIEAVSSVLRVWSKSAKLPPSKPTPKPHLYVEAYRLGVGADRRLVARIAGRDTFVFASSKSGFTDLTEVKDAYKDFATAPRTWAEFVNTRFAVHVVKKVITDVAVIYTCSCPEGHRKRLCKHALHVMCSPDVGMFSYPPSVAELALQNKRKRGRPAKVTTQNRYAVN